MFLEFILIKKALDTALAFNTRLALDGGGPCGLLGVLHCFGLFDRPSTSSQPIYGRVPIINSRHHVGKLNLPRYQQHF